MGEPGRVAAVVFFSSTLKWDRCNTQYIFVFLLEYFCTNEELISEYWTDLMFFSIQDKRLLEAG